MFFGLQPVGWLRLECKGCFLVYSIAGWLRLECKGVDYQ